MADWKKVEAQIEELIDLANETTGNQDTNLTDGVNALVGGYGQGGSGGISVSFKTDTVKAIGSVKRSDNFSTNVSVNAPMFSCTMVAETTTTS